jgi:hypothetical protein
MVEYTIMLCFFRIRQRDERVGRGRKEVAELLFEDGGDSETTFDTLLLRVDRS